MIGIAKRNTCTELDYVYGVEQSRIYNIWALIIVTHLRSAPAVTAPLIRIGVPSSCG